MELVGLKKASHVNCINVCLLSSEFPKDRINHTVTCNVVLSLYVYLYTLNVISWCLNYVCLTFPFNMLCFCFSKWILYLKGCLKTPYYTEVHFSLIPLDKSSITEKKIPKCVSLCVFQIHSRVPALALFPGPSERGRRCPLPHCQEEPQAEMHFLTKTPSWEELQGGRQLSGPLPIQDSPGTHLDHDVHLVLEILLWSL